MVVILALLGGAYFYFSGSPKDNSSLLATSEVGSDATVIGTNILVLLNQITSLKIDTALFTSPVYNSLVDHTVPVYEQNVGKKNPFLYSLPAKAK